MNQPSLNPAPEHPDAEPIIDFKAIANWVGFGWRCAGRHKRLVFGVAAVIVVLAGIAVFVLPKTYHVETKLLAQKNQVLANRNDTGTEDPTRAAADTVLRRENLVALVKRINLVAETARHRAPALRVKDWLVRHLGKPPPEEEQVDGLARYLATKMNVWSSEGTVTIQLDWPDGQLAYAIVREAQNTFLEARHVQEIAAIAEAASIREGHATELRAQIDKAVQEILTLRDDKDKKQNDIANAKRAALPNEKAPPPGPSRAPMLPAALPSAEEISAKRRLAELNVIIDGKERAIAGLDEFRRRRVAELQAKLEEQRAVYTEAHPAVADVKQAIAAASQNSPQVAALRTELTQLNAEAEKLRAQTGTPAPAGAGGWRGGGKVKDAALPRDVIRIEQEPAEDRDPEIVFARSRLKFAIDEYQQIETQIQATRLDLDTAQAAFKYRYAVIVPAEVPKGPIKPKIPLVLIGALLGGLLIGLFSAIVSDLRSGRILEAWQVQHLLELPVLTEIRLPLDGFPETPGSPER